MSITKVVEYVFFFILLAGSGYLVWQVMSPFVGALALSIIIVTICYPLYEKVLKYSYKNNKSIAAGITTLAMVFMVILPLVLISSLFIRELASFYQTLGVGQELTIEKYVLNVQNAVQVYIPDFELNLTEQIRQSAEWLVKNIGAIFAGTVSTLFIVLISVIGSFYFFRDGREFVKIAIKISPLPDSEDEIIISRLAVAIRSVATGVVLVSLVQGVLAASGFAIFGIDRAVLWGAVGAILSMIPGVGTIAIMIPGVIYLAVTGTAFNAIGLAIWTLLMIVLVDNILGPHLMSRGNNLHPFIILTSVLGGISTFGPIGFIIGPVIVTLFIVLLEVYNQYIAKDKGRDKAKTKEK
jgi:predicted PurR-regulated permease PerM